MAFLVLVVLCGCKTRIVTQEVPVVVEHTTVQHHTDIVRDTLIQRDSVYHFVHGDTVIIERWHNAVNINKVLVSDTIRDTIPIVTEVVRTEVHEVAKPPPWWLKALAFVGGIALCVLIAPRALSLIKRLWGK